MYARATKAMPLAGTGSTSRLKDAAMRLYARALRACRCRRGERELMRASDALLKDIGITRSEIAGVVWLGVEDETRIRR